MKNIFISRAAAIILLFPASMVFGQSFQNTFNPKHDDNYVAGVAVNQAYWSAGNTSSFGPSVGTNHILFSKYNNVGASVWDRKYYDAAVPAIKFTATDVQAGYNVFINSPGNSNPPLPCILTLCPMAGTAVNAIGAPNSQNYFYVSGYYFDPAFNVRRLLVMKLNNTGAILWSRTNVLPAGGVFDEAGVSVESCPNGDAMVVSEVFSGGIFYPAVTRLDNAGNLIWRFKYPPATGEQPYNFNPHQSCIFKEKVVNIDNSPTGIAIVGECTNPANPAVQSFMVMRVAYNGAMVWKFNYPLNTSASSHDVGWDIMTEAEPLGMSATVDNFIVTGLTNNLGIGPIPGAKGFAARMSTTTGAFLSCYRFGLPAVTVPPSQYNYGQGIYQSNSGAANIVITGGLDDPANGVNYDTYLLEMSITTGAQLSAHRYSLTRPGYPQTESVVTVPTTYPTPGFYISTNSLNTYGATLTDGHVIKTDVLGRVNNLGCHSDTVVFSRDSVGATMVSRCTEQHCDVIATKVMTKKNINSPHVLCFWATKMDDTEGMESLPDMDENEMAVYPNPVQGSQVQLLLTLQNGGDYDLTVLNVNGQVMEKRKVNLTEGNSEFTLTLNQVPEGVYVVRLTNGEVNHTAKFIKVK